MYINFYIETILTLKYLPAIISSRKTACNKLSPSFIGMSVHIVIITHVPIDIIIIFFIVIIIIIVIIVSIIEVVH